MNYKLIAYAQDFASFLLETLNEKSDKITNIILFGSAARGEADKKSDIDLFIDGQIDNKLEDKINQIKEQFYESVKIKKYWHFLGIKNKINLSIGKLKKWGDLQRSVIANGIVLYGKYSGEPKLKSYYLFIISPGKDRNKNIIVWRKLYGYIQKIGKKKYIQKGIISEYTGKKLAKGVFIIPLEHAQKLIFFLRKAKFKAEIFPIWKED